MLILEYFSYNWNIIIEQIKDASPSVNWVEIVNCVFNFATLLGGAWCFVFIRKLKEKQLDATFSFITRLGFRIKILVDSLEADKDKILDVLCIHSKRIDSFDESDSYSEKTVEKFLSNTKETLKMVLDSDNQIPVQRGWTDKYITFIEFLDVYSRSEDPNYFLWTQDAEKEGFYNKHISNMKSLLNDIQSKQRELEKKLTKKH